MNLALCISSKRVSARTVQTARNKPINGRFLLAVESGWKKQVHRITLSRAKQNGAQALEPIWTRSTKAVTKMTMTTLLKSSGEQVPMQSKELNCPSQQRFKMRLVVQIKFIGARRFAPSWNR